MARDQFPSVSDGNGYDSTWSDFTFLRISSESAWALADRKYPLGMTQDQYTRFVQTLLTALNRESISDADLRLHGSSAHLYSAAHKKMTWSRADVIEQFRKARGELPEQEDGDAIEYIIGLLWPNPAKRPSRRMFDIMFRLDLQKELSDYNLRFPPTR